MLRYLKLILLFVRVNIQDDAAYRVNFLMRIVIAIVQTGGEAFTLWIIFSNTKSLADWNLPELIVVMGVFRTMIGVISLVIAPNMRAIMDDIRQGTLDYVLTKPINSQFYASVRKIILFRLADIALGLVLVVVGCVMLSADVPISHVAQFAGLLVAGVVIIYSFWLVLATTAFWFIRLDNIEMVFWNLFEAARYPVDIYRPWLRWLLTFMLPVAFLTTIPPGILTGKTEPIRLAAALIIAPLALAGASLFWRMGLRHYSGASA
jgi:ABC-2 type transport system permease protein